MTVQPIRPEMPGPGEPGGEHKYPERGFGGWAYARGGCRCDGCTAAVKAAGAKGARNRSANARARKARDQVEDVNATPAGRVAGALNDIAGAAKGGATRTTPTGGATRAQLDKVATMLLVYGSVVWVSIGLRGVTVNENVKDELALSDAEAGSIAAPFVRALHQSDLNRQYGLTVVENSDMLTAAVTAAMYLSRTSQTLATIRAEQGPREAAPNERAVRQPGRAEQPGGPGVVPDAAPMAPGAPYVPGSQQLLD